MLYPTPRTDRWDPWIVGALCAVGVGVALLVRLL